MPCVRSPGALLPAKFAMVIMPASTSPALPEDGIAAEIAARVASGPGFWTEWLAELEREGLLEALSGPGQWRADHCVVLLRILMW